MSRPITELEQLMMLLIDEHEKLLSHLEAQQSAMKKLDLKGMEASVRQQEASRLRIATLEGRRRALVSQLAAALKIPGTPNVAELAEALPQHKQRLMQLRGRLRELVETVSSRAHVAGRVAGAVLGHLNTAVRMLAGAVEQAGVYTKHGVPKVSQRIGVLEAVG